MEAQGDHPRKDVEISPCKYLQIWTGFMELANQLVETDDLELQSVSVLFRAHVLKAV